MVVIKAENEKFTDPGSCCRRNLKFENSRFALIDYVKEMYVPIAVITVEPAGKASFVLGRIQTRLMGQYNGN